LEKGVISFAPGDGTGAPATANVENGRYELRTTAGKKVVQISAPVVVDKRKEHPGKDAAWVDITSERLPPRFNSKSELTFDVQPGSNTKDWIIDLKKK